MNFTPPGYGACTRSPRLRSAVAIDASSFRDKPYRGEYVPALDRAGGPPQNTDGPNPTRNDAVVQKRDLLSLSFHEPSSERITTRRRIVMSLVGSSLVRVGTEPRWRS